METIAITEWDKGVSPLYDAACSLSIMTAEGKRTFHNIASLSLIEKAAFCKAKHVDVLICGAISTMAVEILVKRGIRVISWICGPVDAISNNYRACGDIDEQYVMPGCCKKYHGEKHQPTCRHQKRSRKKTCIKPVKPLKE
jgi:predicted Fe-Mo cluster-binding NifX family protein